MKVDFGGEYLNGENVKANEIIEIAGEGTVQSIDDKQHPGQTKQVLNVPVISKGEKKVWTPNKKSGRALTKVWGDETKNWIGKKFAVNLIKQNVFGEVKDVIYAVPITEAPVQKIPAQVKSDNELQTASDILDEQTYQG